MRVNVYTEELLTEADGQPIVEVVTANYVSSRTGLPMTNYGLRFFMKSAPDLHYIPGRDDDRSAVTIWCGSKESNVFKLLGIMHQQAYASTLKIWRDKTVAQQAAAEEALRRQRQDTDGVSMTGGGRGGDGEQIVSRTGGGGETVAVDATRTRRHLNPAPERPELMELLERSKKAYENMTFEQRQEMLEQQCRSWVIGEMMLSNPNLTRVRAEEIFDSINSPLKK